jgi:DNA-directed RNA polymerase subunit RPC12/RpoP
MMSEKLKNGEGQEPADGSNHDRLMWEYRCRACTVEFSTTVPRGPAEEHKITCTGCGSRDIGRIGIPALREMAFGA